MQATHRLTAPFVAVGGLSAAPVVVTSFLGNPVAWTETAGALTMGAAGYESELSVGGVQISKHAAERMVERGITHKMVEIGISKGTKYFDPKNGISNYVLQKGFASGKDLLIGISPQTGKVTTVLRGNNLVNKRFILR